MELDLPKRLTLNVYGVKYRVKQKNMHTCAGLCEWGDEKTLYICSEDNETFEEKMATLLHEHGHAITKEIHITMGVPHDLLELVVEAFAQNFMKNYDIFPKGMMDFYPAGTNPPPVPRDSPQDPKSTPPAPSPSAPAS